MVNLFDIASGSLTTPRSVVNVDMISDAMMTMVSMIDNSVIDSITVEFLENELSTLPPNIIERLKKEIETKTLTIEDVRDVIKEYPIIETKIVELMGSDSVRNFIDTRYNNSTKVISDVISQMVDNKNIISNQIEEIVTNNSNHIQELVSNVMKTYIENNKTDIRNYSNKMFLKDVTQYLRNLNNTSTENTTVLNARGGVLNEKLYQSINNVVNTLKSTGSVERNTFTTMLENIFKGDTILNKSSKEFTQFSDQIYSNLSREILIDESTIQNINNEIVSEGDINNMISSERIDRILQKRAGDLFQRNTSFDFSVNGNNVTEAIEKNFSLFNEGDVYNIGKEDHYQDNVIKYYNENITEIRNEITEVRNEINDKIVEVVAQQSLKKDDDGMGLKPMRKPQGDVVGPKRKGAEYETVEMTPPARQIRSLPIFKLIGEQD